ncbi:MAG: hypothetical protein H6824_02615 [Planctomycetaceae bacterium]|nr:hypothetical protein [Planctomycetaceae bacterium]
MIGAPTLQRFALESDENEPFSVQERQQVIERLARVEARVLDSRDFQENESQFIRIQFEHLRRESERAGRVSWFQMMIGISVSIIATYFTADVATQLWQFINSEFTQFLRIGN